MRRPVQPILFRSGATFWPFLVWALAAATAAVFAEREALARPPGLHRWIFHGLFAAGLLVGPLSFAVQLLRRRLLSVRLDPELGLVLRGDRLVPWSDIEAVDHRPSPFSKPSTYFDEDEVGNELGHTPAEIGALIMLVRSVITIVYHLVLPPLLLLTPWHPRVILRMHGGGSLVLRNLERDGEFVYRVRRALRPVPTP